MNPFLPAHCQESLVLASRSPRRSDIMAALGFTFEIDPPSEDTEEGISHDDPYALPEILACHKRDEVAARHANETVIAADTLVIVGRDILSKPRDDAEALAFLSRLSGKTHTVVTGVAVRNGRTGVSASGAERTLVTFRQLGDDGIAAYVAAGEGRDKAGSYAAQGHGAAMIERFDGCYYNVVGLPVALLLNLLEKTG